MESFMSAAHMAEADSHKFEVFRVEMDSDKSINRPFETLLNNLISYKSLISELYDNRPFEISVYQDEVNSGNWFRKNNKPTYLVKTCNYKYIRNYLSEFVIKNDNAESLNSAKFVLDI